MAIRAHLVRLLAIVVALAGVSLTWAASPAQAAPIPVSGLVVDAGTGIADAYVWADGLSYDDATTDATGAYALDLEPGSYEIHASAAGYEDDSVIVAITESTTTIAPIELQAIGEGLEFYVYSDTFGVAANAKVSLAPAEGAATVLTTDEDGRALFEGLSPGQYDASILAGNGYLAGPIVPVDYAGGYDYLELSATIDLACEPAAASTGLTNMGFENGLDSWTLGYQTESIQAVGADAFASPWEGSKMARLGNSQPSAGGPQPAGQNVMCQDFDVTDAEETFAFNVFTYDYTGFDEFRFDVVVTDPGTGETLAAYEQGAWGSDTDLKTSGWRGVKLDLAEHVGDTVRLTFRAGGTSDSLYAFWAYVDSAATLPPTVETSNISVQTTTGSVTTDPTTGQMTISMPSGDPSALTMTLPAECQDEATTPTSVSLILDGTPFTGTLTGSGLFTVTIPQASMVSGQLSIQIECPEETTLVLPIGQIVLYDPSGIISDAETGQPVVGAEVRLFKVPGWTPQDADGPHPDTSCQTNLSKAPDEPWSQPAPTDLGQLVNAASPEISPHVNPFVTNNVGYYGWDVAEGCWYVVVEANGYETLTSPVVGVPTEVTDLDLAIQPKPLPSTTKPTISGEPKVGSTLTASPGAWNQDGATFTYQWLRNGTTIPGATGKTYDVAAADVDRSLSVRVTAHKSGYLNGTETSSTVTGKLGDAPQASAAPAISGDPRVGSTLTASPGTWNLTGTDFAYQWMRNGSPIANATTSSYAVAAADASTALSVRVTATKAGHQPGSALSAAVQVAVPTVTPPVVAPPAVAPPVVSPPVLTPPVLKAESKVVLKAPKRATAGKRVRVKVAVGVSAGAAATGKVVIKAGKKTVGSGTLKAGKVTIKIKKLKPGTYKLVARYAGSATVLASVSKKVRLKVVRAG